MHIYSAVLLYSVCFLIHLRLDVSSNDNLFTFLKNNRTAEDALSRIKKCIIDNSSKQILIHYLLYMRTSGFHNLLGVILKSLTPPYSVSFQRRLQSFHSCRKEQTLYLSCCSITSILQLNMYLYVVESSKKRAELAQLCTRYKLVRVCRIISLISFSQNTQATYVFDTSTILTNTTKAAYTHIHNCTIYEARQYTIS